MWIASKLGFFSIVQKQPGEWHVRSRVRADLVNLVDAVYTAPAEVAGAIEEWPEADYRWRLIVGEGEEMSAIFQALFRSVDYPNFKGVVAATPGQEAKLPAYHALWHTLHQLQSAAG